MKWFCCGHWHFILHYTSEESH